MFQMPNLKEFDHRRAQIHLGGGALPFVVGERDFITQEVALFSEGDSNR